MIVDPFWRRLKCPGQTHRLSLGSKAWLGLIWTGKGWHTVGW
jgi:hypothetical protein